MHGLQRFIFITLFSVCSAVQAGGEPEDIQALRNLLKPITSLSAKFTQEVSDADGFLLQASEGLFQVSQTAKLRWIVEQPMQQQIISDGETLWVFDPDLEQVIVQPFNQDIAATPAILFSGDLDQLDAAFIIREQAAGQFVLTPEQSGSLFNSMEIIFVDQQPVSISLTDNLEQVTTIAFTELVLNPNLAANLFVFEIPSGVDVINNAN
jgi:outer membrane lipoprotein carrier protein